MQSAAPVLLPQAVRPLPGSVFLRGFPRAAVQVASREGKPCSLGVAQSLEHGQCLSGRRLK